MGKKIFRKVAMILAAILIMTMPGMSVLAKEGINTYIEEQGPVVEEQAPVVEEQAPVVEKQAPVVEKQLEQKQDSEIKQKMENISYIYVDEELINGLEKQRVAIGLTNTELVNDNAILTYKSLISGKVFTTNCVQSTMDSLLFEMIDNQELVENEYLLEKLTFGDEKEIVFTDEGINATYKYINSSDISKKLITEDYKTSDGVETPKVVTYSVDQKGVQSVENGENIEKTVKSALQTIKPRNISIFGKGRRASNGNLVVAVCAGHDSTHTGAAPNGLREETLNLKIAQACKEELEAYTGVRVCMVRPGEGCPYPGTNLGQCLRNRVDTAIAAGADIFLDLHLNSSQSGANGAEVYYPNASYNSGISQEGKLAADQILAQLVALGLNNRGTKVLNATGNPPQTDSQGNLADYYTSINYCKERGIPGLIVEHAFMNGTQDYERLLDDGFLRALGVADATGIANRYGLSKENPKINVVEKNDFNGTFTIRATGMKRGQNLKAFVWGIGQNATDVCYKLKEQPDGSYIAQVKKEKHQNYTGKYYVALYRGKDMGVVPPELASSSVVLEMSSGNTTILEEKGIFEIASIIENQPKEVVGFKYAIWPEKKAAKWYAANNSKGKWSGNVNIADFGTYGKYYIDTYAEYNDGRMVYVTSDYLSVAKPTIDYIGMENLDNLQGSFDVILKGIKVPTGLKDIRVAVWSAGHSVKWYEATKESEDVYKVSVNVKNHDFSQGMYFADAYVNDALGIMSYVKGTKHLVLPEKTEVSATDTDMHQKIFELKVANISALYDTCSIRFAVWPVGGSVRWYQASVDQNKQWCSSVNISDFKKTGKYYVDAYSCNSRNILSYCGGTTFHVEAPKVEKISIIKKDGVNGTFDVEISGVSSVSGVSEIKVPVWKPGGQAQWYTAKKINDQRYSLTVNLKDFDYETALYYADVYIKDGNQCLSYVGGQKSLVTLRSEGVMVENFDGIQKQYGIQIKGNPNVLNIQKVKVAVWCTGKEVKWYTAERDSNVGWNVNVNICDFKSIGNYYADVYILTKANSLRYYGGATFKVDGAVKGSISIPNNNINEGYFDILISGLDMPSGITEVKVPVWMAGGVAVWYTADKVSKGVYKTRAYAYNHAYKGGKYFIDVYVIGGNQCTSYVGGTTNFFNYSMHPIMGKSSTTVAQMVNYYNCYSPILFPANKLGVGGANSIQEFCQMYYDEASIEGIRAEVAFVQSMLETGFLTYGGDVKIEQYNFAGLGATGGVPGNSFYDVRTGIRGHIQHLKCYASTAPLNRPCVDPRWGNWLRGKASYVEWLSIKSNPNGTGWATDPNYSQKIINRMVDLERK